MVLICGSFLASSILFIADKERPAFSAKDLWLKFFAVLNRITFWAIIRKFMVASYLLYTREYLLTNFVKKFFYETVPVTLPSFLVDVQPKHSLSPQLFSGYKDRSIK
jgi:hypothetical protein